MAKITSKPKLPRRSPIRAHGPTVAGDDPAGSGQGERFQRRTRYTSRDRHSLGFVRSVVNATLGGAVIVGLLAAVGIWRSGDRFLEGARIMLTPAPSQPQVDVRSVIVQQLRGASELTTAIFAMEAVVPAKSDRTFAGYVVGSTNLLYLAYGEVRAGVDLSDISADSVQLDQSSVRITLPPPRILDSKLDLNRSDVYDYDRGFLGLGPDNAPDLQDMAQQEALQKIVEAACSKGILTEANNRAKLTVAQLLSTAGFETVDVQTQLPANALCAAPTSPAPTSPAPTSLPPTTTIPQPMTPPTNDDTVN